MKIRLSRGAGFLASAAAGRGTSAAARIPRASHLRPMIMTPERTFRHILSQRMRREEEAL